MFKAMLQDKISFLILFAIGIITITASNILILDEESIVAGCFVLFIMVCYHMLKDMLGQELQERAYKIQIELDKALDAKKATLLLLKEDNSKQSTLASDITNIQQFVEYQLEILPLKKQTQLEYKLRNSINQELRYLSSKENEMVSLLQKELIVSLCQSVVNEFAAGTSQQIKTIYLKEAIDSLRQMAIKS